MLRKHSTTSMSRRPAANFAAILTKTGIESRLALLSHDGFVLPHTFSTTPFTSNGRAEIAVLADNHVSGFSCHVDLILPRLFLRCALGASVLCFKNQRRNNRSAVLPLKSRSLWFRSCRLL